MTRVASSPGQLALSVSELNAYVKRLLDRDEVLNQIAVRGEISNFTGHRSGHLYFSLKDETCQLRCVCFRGDACRLGFAPDGGQRVVAWGNVTVYEPRGEYQLIVRTMRPDGAGELAEAIEKLRAKLEAEGLFEPSRKRPLPRFPRRIALVTSPTGAAVRDLVSVISRRYPPAELVVVPTLVQGDAAPESIVRSLALAAGVCRADLIIVGRGGGSLEDLWAFYDERVVRAVFACPLPVISAVGHETDLSLCDEVADLRAPTPSAAGELAVPDVRDLEVMIERLGRRACAALEGRLALGLSRLGAVCRRPAIARPMTIVEQRWQRLDDAGLRVVRAMTTVEQRRQRLDDAGLRVMRAMDVSVERLRERLGRTEVTLRTQDRRLRARLLGFGERRRRIGDADRRVRTALKHRRERLRDRFDRAYRTAPKRLLNTTSLWGKIEPLTRRVVQSAQRVTDRQAAALGSLVLSQRSVDTRKLHLEIRSLSQRAGAAVERGQGRRRGHVDRAYASVRALDPHAVVRRGYAIIRSGASGRLVRSIEQTATGDALDIEVSDGSIAATVVDTHSGEAEA